MREVKRFKPVINNKPYRPYAYCEENSEGIYVRIDDYEAIKAERDALAAKVERFAVQCAAAKIAVQYAKSEGFECTLNTPDIDTFLNSVRAEGAFESSAAICRAVTCFKEEHKEVVKECAEIAREIGIGMGVSQLRAGIQIEVEE